MTSTGSFRPKVRIAAVPFLFTESGLSVGTHTIRGLVTDTDGLFAEGVVLLQVNGVPTAPDIALNPDPAVTTDDLTVAIVADSTDVDGDPITYSYAWSVDGVASSASTSATLPSAETTKGQTWSVEVTPNDGYSDGPAGSDGVTIGNTAPSITSVTISPANPAVTDALTCSYSGYSDADGDIDASTYSWTIGGTEVSTASTLSSGYLTGDEVTCTVTAFDGTDSGTALSDSVTIENTAPEIISVTLSPSTVYHRRHHHGDGEFSSDTDDGDAVTSAYAWTVWTAAWSPRPRQHAGRQHLLRQGR